MFHKSTLKKFCSNPGITIARGAKFAPPLPRPWVATNAESPPTPHRPSRIRPEKSPRGFVTVAMPKFPLPPMRKVLSPAAATRSGLVDPGGAGPPKPVHPLRGAPGTSALSWARRPPLVRLKSTRLIQARPCQSRPANFDGRKNPLGPPLGPPTRPGCRNWWEGRPAGNAGARPECWVPQRRFVWWGPAPRR